MDRFRVLHIVENLDRGAVENWLVNVFLESREYRPDWEWTFFCVLGKEGQLDEKVKHAGGRIIYSEVSIANKINFLRGLRKVLKEGAFDAIHMHHDFISGFYLLASAGISAKKIVHVHNNDEGMPVGNERLRQILLPIFRNICLSAADLIVGISRYTLDHFVQNGKCKGKVLYYGINMDRFSVTANRSLFRRSLELPDNAKVLLFVGRMNREKNPVFILDVLQRLLESRKDVYAVFIGKGEFQEIIAQRAAGLGISAHTRITGWSDDIPAAMKASEVFLFPRMLEPKEGLGLVVIESQCAGLHMITTEAIVDDAIVVRSMVSRLPLEASVWADAVSALLEREPAATGDPMDIMKNSPFELTQAALNLIALYEDLGKARK